MVAIVHTLALISVSAIERLEKVRFGSHTVNRRALGARERNHFEYQLIERVNERSKPGPDGSTKEVLGA